jgi:hypothetical protein
MSHHLEDLYLPHGGFLDDLIVFSLFELLDGEDLLVVVAFAFEDYSICALSYHSQYIVFLH